VRRGDNAVDVEMTMQAPCTSPCPMQRRSSSPAGCARTRDERCGKLSSLSNGLRPNRAVWMRPIPLWCGRAGSGHGTPRQGCSAAFPQQVIAATWVRDTTAMPAGSKRLMPGDSAAPPRLSWRVNVGCIPVVTARPSEMSGQFDARRAIIQSADNRTNEPPPGAPTTRPSGYRPPPCAGDRAIEQSSDRAFRKIGTKL
jgi:predicted Fe-S protein YdhL (DUF1289 family)